MLLKRGLLNAFIAHLWPLLVILLSLFLVTWLFEDIPAEEKRVSSTTFRVLSLYTALFFSLILVHRNLRADFPVSREILSIEYLFFHSYLTILLLQVYILIMYSSSPLKKKLLPLDMVKLVYWSIEMGLWLITTIIIFYR